MEEAGCGATAADALGTMRDVGATVAGETRSAVDRTIAQATSGPREVAGQTRGEGARSSGQLDEIVERTARRATAAVDTAPSSGTPYEQWTESDSYERAQELDVDVRSTMSKRQLIAALRAA